MTRPQVWFVACLLILTAAALAIRLPRLGQRPMHGDEANQAVKAGILLETGEYRYDPQEHHGPSLYWLTLPSLWLHGRDELCRDDRNRLPHRAGRLRRGLGAAALGGGGRAGTRAGGPGGTVHGRLARDGLLLPLLHPGDAARLLYAGGAGRRLALRPLEEGPLGDRVRCRRRHDARHEGDLGDLGCGGRSGAGVDVGLDSVARRNVACVSRSSFGPRDHRLSGRRLFRGAWSCTRPSVGTRAARWIRSWPTPRTGAAAARRESTRTRGTIYLELLLAFRPAKGFFWTEGMIVALAAIGGLASLGRNALPVPQRWILPIPGVLHGDADRAVRRDFLQDALVLAELLSRHDSAGGRRRLVPAAAGLAATIRSTATATAAFHRRPATGSSRTAPLRLLAATGAGHPHHRPVDRRRTALEPRMLLAEFPPVRRFAAIRTSTPTPPATSRTWPVRSSGWRRLRPRATT